MWEILSSRLAGYLAATIDGEGTVRQDQTLDISFAQQDNRMLEAATSYLDALKFEYGKSLTGGTNNDVYRIRLEGSKAERLRFLGSIRPEMKLHNFDIERIGTMQAIETVVVDSVYPVGTQEVIALDTSTSTFVAEGYASHNCDYRPKSCSGALPDHLTNLGIVAKGDHRDGSLDVRVEENEEEVTAAIATAIDAQNVSFK